MSCPFCSPEQLDVLAKTQQALLVEAKGSPGNYLVIPRSHITSFFALPPTFMEDVQYLVARTTIGREERPFNLSMNLGRQAGQRVEHVHFWIIDRSGSPKDGLGMAALVKAYECQTGQT